MTGTTLSHYRIVSELGRGGMGIVYLGEDTKLDRQVAIKVLPSSALASDDDRARFYREAKAAAALNHPNIAQIYQIDEAVPSDAPHGTQPSPFIAMEYIDGEPLDDRIKQGPLKLAEAIRLAMQIAGALGAAHEKGIVHRDVKASNVMLTSKGDAKVLDFGLALTAASTKLTRMGSTLGTVAYMSPEQARGEEVDRRTDLWALGVVLYEMVAGRNPFGGDYEQAVVYSILNAEPEPLTAVRTGVPMELEHIVHKALSKDRSTRYQSAADFVADLKRVDPSRTTASIRRSAVDSGSVHYGAPVAGSSANPGRHGRSVRVLLAGGTVIFALGALLAWVLFSTRVDPTESAVYASLEFPKGVTLEPDRSAPLQISRQPIAMSWDGSKVAIIGSHGTSTAVYVRSLDGHAFERIPGTDGAYGVEFSPDGTRLAYYADNVLKIVSVDGGASRDVTGVSLPEGLVWADENRILLSNNEGQTLDMVDVAAGRLDPLPVQFADDEAAGFISPSRVLENGDVLFIGSAHTPGIFLLDMESYEMARIDRQSTQRAMAGSEHVVLSADAGLSIVQSNDIGDVGSGRSVTITPRLMRRYLPFFDADHTGNVIFVEGPNADYREFAWFDPDGEWESLGLGADRFEAFALSPDGNSLAAIVRGVSMSELWVYDLRRRGARTRIPTEDAADLPIWSRDGSRIYFRMKYDGRYTPYSVAVGSSVPPDTLNTQTGIVSWSTPDGRYLAVEYELQGGERMTGYLDVEDPSTIEPFPYQFPSPISRISRSGRYVAFTDNTTGDYEVFIQPFPPDGREWKATTGGGEEPLWTEGDEAIIYRNGDRLLHLEVSIDGDTPVFGRTDTLFVGRFENPGGYSTDIGQDGRILMLRPAEPIPDVRNLRLLLNAPALSPDDR